MNPRPLARRARHAAVALLGSAAAVTVTSGTSGAQILNRPPVATDDSYTVAAGTELAVYCPGVLANDSDPDGDPLEVVDITDPAHGGRTVNECGAITYTPDAGFTGTDSFTYTVGDGRGAVATATVTITVTPENQPPVAADDAYTTPVDTPLSVPAPGVLANDGDPDGDPLHIDGDDVFPYHGSIEATDDGGFVYTPDPGFTGADSFGYVALDPSGETGSAMITITVTGEEEPDRPDRGSGSGSGPGSGPDAGSGSTRAPARRATPTFTG